MKFIITAFTAALLACSSANAAIVFGNLGPSGTGALDTISQQISSTTWLAQGFTTPASGLLSLDSIVLGLSVNSGSTGTRVQLFADGGGAPAGSALATLGNSVSSTTPTLYTFSLGTPYLLSASATYWLVVSDPDGGDFNWNFNDAAAAPSAQNASGYLWPSPGTLRSTDSGSSWGPRLPSATAAFYLNASSSNPVPEPGTWAVAVLLAGGAVFMRWRRRAKAA